MIGVHMQKLFSQRLNEELDNIGVPHPIEKRIDILAKLIKIPKLKAEAFLQGTSLPDTATLNLIAEELEVTVDWLMGKDED